MNEEHEDSWEFNRFSLLLFSSSLSFFFSGAKFSDARLKEVSFAGGDLSRVSFKRANLEGANLSRCMLVDADFRNAMLKDVNLAGAVLHRANLRGAVLTVTNTMTAEQLDGAHVDLVQFKYFQDLALGLQESAIVVLKEVFQQYAKLDGIILAGLDLSGCIITSSDLTKANLKKGDFTKGQASFPFVPFEAKV